MLRVDEIISTGKIFSATIAFRTAGIKSESESCLRGKTPPSFRRRLRQSFRPAFHAPLSLHPSARREYFRSWLSVSIRRVDMRLHRDEIDHAAKSFFRADRHLQRDNVAAENFCSDSIERSKLDSSRSIQVRTKRARNIVLRAIIPNFFRGHLSADVRVHGDQRGVRGNQRSFRFRDESGIARQIDEINFDGVAATQKVQGHSALARPV